MQARIAIALFALAVLLHWPSGPTEFVYDDVDFVVQNASIRSLESAALAFQLPFPPDQPERGLYRPLTTLVYVLEYGVWGDDSRGYHLVSSVLYGLLAVLVYALACDWFGRRSGTAAAAAILFIGGLVIGVVLTLLLCGCGGKSAPPAEPVKKKASKKAD